MNRIIILNLDEDGIKFEKPVPRLACDCGPCRQKIRAMKGRMSDQFFHKEKKDSCPDSDLYLYKNSSKISMQKYLYAKAMAGEKSGFAAPSMLPTMSKKSSAASRDRDRESISNVFR